MVYKGRLNPINIGVVSTTAYVCLTVRLTGHTGTKVGCSDPIVQRGMTIAQRIKVTPGITG